jgi:hypothetical protein
MITGLATAVMSLAGRCLGENRREWALAMQGEFDAAIADGRPLAFAVGCLIAAWREMPTQGQGRFVLANYALALGLLVPTAGLQFAFVVGLPRSFLGQGGLYTLLAPGSAGDPYLADAHASAIPTLLLLWVLLGAGHLRIAWVLLERDWSRVISTAALTVAVSATLVIFTGVLLLDDAAVALQAALLAMELSAIFASARWHARLFPSASSGNLAR